MWIDAVLPLALRDAERAEFLLDSLARHCSGLRRIWIVCPDFQVAELAKRFRSRGSCEIRVESELNLIPELAFVPKVSGWFRQQLIKLAIHERVESELYLTLDADVVCTRPVTAAELIREGRAACYVWRQPEFQYWYDRVEAVLRLRAPRRGIMHNVTPALLHRAAVRELRETIEAKVANGEYSLGMRGLKQRWFLYRARRRPEFARWRTFLIGARPWTEYALYYTFLEATGRFERYHFESPYCLYDIERSLWNTAQAELPADWDPSPAFVGSGPPWFLVAQSNTGVSAAAVRAKLEPLLNAASPAASTELPRTATSESR